jgi:hypothetical protein
VRLDKRAGVLAAGAVVIADAVGFWSGAARVAAGLAGLFSAVVLQLAAARQESVTAQRARLAAAEAAFAPGIADPGGGGVARYLRPEAEAVRFWPRPELAALLGWVAAGDRVAVRLVTGPGGAGKTAWPASSASRPPGWAGGRTGCLPVRRWLRSVRPATVTARCCWSRITPRPALGCPRC